MVKDNYTKAYQMQALVAMLIRNKKDIRTRNITRDWGGHENRANSSKGHNKT